MTKDEVLKDLRATFPMLPIEFLAPEGWNNKDWLIGAYPATAMPDKMPFFGGYDSDGYTNSIHDAFLAWLDDRGFCLETEDCIWYQLAPAPTEEEKAIMAEIVRANLADPNFECPF